MAFYKELSSTAQKKTTPSAETVEQRPSLSLAAGKAGQAALGAIANSATIGTVNGAGKGYTSQYQDQINAGINNITNREKFTYDPLQDANYQAMAKLYGQQGEKAAKNTMGDAAALNGGFGSSYAMTAAQQMRNDYNQQLASQIPALYEAAYGRYVDDYNMDLSALQLLQDADDSAYGRYRDTVSDRQWQQSFDYQKERDSVSDKQWQQSYDRDVYESDRDFDRSTYEYDTNLEYQKERDQVADKQWAKEYALSKKASSGSSGSGSGGGSYYSTSGSTASTGSSDTNPYYDEAKNSNQKTASARAFRNEKARKANEGKYARR